MQLPFKIDWDKIKATKVDEDNSSKSINTVDNEVENDGDEAESLIKIRAYFTYCVFPKPPIVLGEGDDTFGITRWEVAEVLQGHPIINNVGQVCITGEFVEPIEKGKPYIILAKRSDHPTYGIQYKLLYINQQIDLSKSRNQRAFLSSFLSDKQIDEFYKIYQNPIEIIQKHDIEALKKVHGVGPYIAQCIIDRFEENKDLSKVYEELDNYGFTPNFIQKLVKTYRSSSTIVDIVKNNPYALCDTVEGVGFKTADNIALKGGLYPKSVSRVKAFIVNFLETQAYEAGDSYVTAGELLTNIYGYFGGKENIAEDILDENSGDSTSNIALAIKELQDENIIQLEEGENKSRRRVYLNKIKDLEEQIAYHLNRLLKAENRFNYSDWQNKIAILEKKQGFKFAQEQIDGIKLGLKSQVCLISGLAGSGKSSLVSGILAGLDRYDFAQCALSGKAAARLQEVTGQEGSTIHRLLMYNGGGFEYNEHNNLPYDIIILDEVSLVGGDIFLDLIKAIRSGSKLIMLGDLGQLESIGTLNLAADIFNSVEIPTVELKEIHRQAAMSGIITTAHQVRHQEQIFETSQYEGEVVLGELKDMILDMTTDRSTIRQKTMAWFKKYFDSELVNKDIMKIQVLAPVKERGDACVHNLNLDIQEFYNPVNLDDDWEIRIKMGKKDNYYYIHEKDKVMCIKNNYHTMDEEGYVCPIYNGWTGIVREITNSMVVVYFPLAGGNVIIPMKDARSNLILGYASTIHKMQGSDYPVIIGTLDYSTPPKMLTNSLLYTLMTRAKKMCVVIAETAAFNQAISTNFVSTKRTFLKEFITNYDK